VDDNRTDINLTYKTATDEAQESLQAVLCSFVLSTMQCSGFKTLPLIDQYLD